MNNQNLIKRGSIFYCAFKNKDGSVQNGLRPAIIVQNDVGNLHSSTVVVAPITSVPKRFDLPTHVFIGTQFGLHKDSMILAEQLTTINKEDLREFVGITTEDFMKIVDKALKVSVGLSKKHNQDIFVACLCHTCLDNFFATHNYEIHRVDRFQTEKDTCTYCQTHRGYDYRITKRNLNSNNIND
ncbi:MAG: type II toxin-antitoxin system PemK/MazF family toxin [Clostridia bacterium]|nr:type II toxin-antitoxin system PemK/MazF family toxin [Clostridia bacterium]